MNINKTKIVIDNIPQDVTLVAVTKNQNIDDVRVLQQLGITNFGENKLQELKKKKEIFPDCNWHFIGRIQSNKIKDIVKHSCLIHSVSEERYLKLIDQEASKLGIVQDVLIQFNIAGEVTKKGISQDEFDMIINNPHLYPNVSIKGMMVMGAHSTDQQLIKDTFDQVYNLYSRIASSNPNFDILSMGMSGDYQLALSSGSTMLRIGSLLFKD